MTALRVYLLLAATLLIAACETTGGWLFSFAAQGTQIEAERVVAQVYGLPGKPIPWTGVDVAAPLQRMQARFPQVREALAAGRLGLTEDGYLAIRAVEGQVAELKKLLRDENRDRQFLYRAVSEAAGHGGMSLLGWMAYTEDRFGAEWRRQAPAGWWQFDVERGWQRLPVVAVPAVGG